MQAAAHTEINRFDGSLAFARSSYFQGGASPRCRKASVKTIPVRMRGGGAWCVVRLGARLACALARSARFGRRFGLRSLALSGSSD